MISKIEIKNFKSISDLSIDLGRVNVIIGENGCGKTNILEAIALASTAAQGSLTSEAMGRKFRYVAPDFMLPAFADIEPQENNIAGKLISVYAYGENEVYKGVSAIYEPKKKEWINVEPVTEDLRTAFFLKRFKGEHPEIFKDIVESLPNNEAFVEALDASDFLKLFEESSDVMQAFKNAVLEKPDLNSFLIYNPEESKLRQFGDESQIYPLGRNGEGLFRYLKEIHTGDKADILARIVEKMSLLDWVDGMTIPDDLLSTEYRLQIGDKYLRESLHYFDQRGTNEGFLFLLFYLTLFSSPDTPPFFAIDNIEAAFNPKLCTELVRNVVDLAKANEKQVIMTTHSPYVLDGLDLSDNDQRLFVARRNRDGHTVIKRIPAVEGLKMRLSEVWMKGMIGGLPDNF